MNLVIRVEETVLESEIGKHKRLSTIRQSGNVGGCGGQEKRVREKIKIHGRVIKQADWLKYL